MVVVGSDVLGCEWLEVVSFIQLLYEVLVQRLRAMSAHMWIASLWSFIPSQFGGFKPIVI